MTRPLPAAAMPAKRKPKFRAKQVVMVRAMLTSDKEDPSYDREYPVKLVKRTRIGTAESGIAWFDTLGNVEYEKRMRPLSKREAGR